jgi:hypothetical protein
MDWVPRIAKGACSGPVLDQGERKKRDGRCGVWAARGRCEARLGALLSLVPEAGPGATCRWEDVRKRAVVCGCGHGGRCVLWRRSPERKRCAGLLLSQVPKCEGHGAPISLEVGAFERIQGRIACSEHRAWGYGSRGVILTVAERAWVAIMGLR